MRCLENLIRPILDFTDGLKYHIPFNDRRLLNSAMWGVLTFPGRQVSDGAGISGDEN